MLLHLEYGLIVNTDTIASIKELPATGSIPARTEFAFLDGSHKFIRRRFEDFEWCAGQIIPAPPGYQVIQAFPPEKDGEAATFDIYPVIAFRLTDDEPVPLTPLGKLGDHWALVWPDGRCDEQWNRLYPSVEAFKASFGKWGERS